LLVVMLYTIHSPRVTSLVSTDSNESLGDDGNIEKTYL
jgi:hypothetical protein